MSSTTAPYGASATSANTDLALLVARILLVVVFPISGYFKVMQWPGIVTLLTNQGAPLPLVGGYLAILAEFILPVLVVLGIKARWAALGLILYVAGATIIGHRFWEFPAPAQFGQMMSFFKNLAMMGGLGLIAVIGPGRYALQPRG